MSITQYNFPEVDRRRIFEEADKQLKSKKESKTVKNPKEIPMPFIHGCKGAKEQIVVTENWYVKEKKSQLARVAENKKDAQIEMMQLIAKRDRLRYKLGKLDPSKKKDSKLIVTINIQLKDIEAELKTLQQLTGINIDKLDRGTRLGRFVGKIKKIFHKVKKVVKRWYNEYEDVIKGVLAIAIPVVVSTIAKKIIAIFA